MSIQSRYYNYGSQYYAWDDNDARYAVTPDGVYRGFDLGVDIAADLTIAAGYGCMPDGIVWKEDAITTIAFSPVAPATNYTVVALHTDSMIGGGVEVTYELQAGILTTVTDGVILGWIYYPGGSVNLALTHLVSAPKMLLPDYAAAIAEHYEGGLREFQNKMHGRLRFSHSQLVNVGLANLIAVHQP